MAACRADSPPQLLHKADLAGPAAGQLPPELGDRLESDRHRVLGVVVNAVDDHLGATDQLDFPWTVATITPLGQLLGHALRGQRTVVLVADHGHVLERGTDLRPGGEGAGDRWRTGTPGEGEVALEGQRVLLGGGAVVVPWTERLRYTPKRAGYHGGATPQEVVTPLLVLAPAGRAVAGWREVPSERPSWWSEPRAQEPVAVEPLPAPAPFADGQFGLFEEPGTTSVVQAALHSAPVRAAARPWVQMHRTRTSSSGCSRRWRRRQAPSPARSWRGGCSFPRPPSARSGAGRATSWPWTAGRC